MHKYKSICIVVLMAVLGLGKLLAQEKFEKESRINEKEVPSKAFQFIEALNIKHKIKWYKEEGLSNISYEAKFKLNKAKHSVEFDTLGNIEDVEIEINWEAAAGTPKEAVALQLEKDCSKHKINKAQIQYTGSESQLLSKLKTNENNPLLTINYELIVRCCNEKKVVLYEYLFSETGIPISISTIVFKSSSHLEY